MINLIILSMGFKENLKEQLNYSGMHVKELAYLSGIKKQTIDSYLNTNSHIPSAEAAVAIARVLGVSVEYLVTGIEVKKKEIPHQHEARIIADMYTELSDKSRKMALTIINTMRKLEKPDRKSKYSR
ncbi:MAG: helix-turn-helix domain-containing protein [Treponema sp.]|nr:helix-turn-helix domain-containing protein [Treponema sp.]